MRDRYFYELDKADLENEKALTKVEEVLSESMENLLDDLIHGAKILCYEDDVEATNEQIIEALEKHLLELNSKPLKEKIAKLQAMIKEPLCS